MNRIILLFFLFNTFFINAALLEVEVDNILEEGILHLAIYDSKETFEADKGDKPGPQEGIVEGVIKFVKTGISSEKFELPNGIYAIGIYVDSNENNILDTNFFGMPKEQFGFSNNVFDRFGPPSFESASFQLDDYKKISVNLK